MSSLPSFKTVHASVRPARVAVLIDKTDSHWEHTCLRIIEFFSQMWGGMYNLIVPTDGKTIDERFWTILEAFDADHLYVYRKSGEDIRLSTPDEYRRIVDAHVNSYIAQFGPGETDASERIRDQIDENLRGGWASDFGVAPTLQNEVKIRLAPFYFEQWIVDAGAVGANSSVSFPLTSVAKIIANTEHPDRFASITVPADSVPELWYSAVCGALRNKGVTDYEEIGLTRDTFDFDIDNLGQLMDFVITGQMQGPWALEPNERNFAEINGITPFQLSMLQLGLYRSTKYQAWSEPMILVIGNMVEDFCLYYCLSRMRERVVWVLPSITQRALGSGSVDELSPPERHFISQLYDQKYSQKSQGGLAYTSYSLSDAELDTVVTLLNSSMYGRLESIRKANAVHNLVRMPLVAIERDNFQRDVPVQLSGEFTISPFNTPKPKNFHTIHPYEHRYITQLSVARESPPKHFYLGQWTISDHRLTTHEVRVGKDGPAYFCPSTMYFGGDIDTVLVRPYLRLPELPKILAHLAKSQGFECHPSDKGIYAEETIARWGSLEEVARFLRDRSNKQLLDLFLDTSPSAEGKGVYLRDDRRRYLDFAAVKTFLGEATGRVIDGLVSKQIFYRGFIFRCEYCRNSTWFSVGEITQEFRCRRCNRSQIYTRAHWKMPEEPAWFYKLDELVYQGYRQGMLVTLLALNYLKQESFENFSFATEREFWRPEEKKAEAEVDLLCVSDGVLTIGEAKTEDRLGKSTSDENGEIAKYKRIVAGLCARRLILATFSKDWNPQTMQRVIAEFASMPHVKVQFLAHDQLIGN